MSVQNLKTYGDRPKELSDSMLWNFLEVLQFFKIVLIISWKSNDEVPSSWTFDKYLCCLTCSYDAIKLA